MQGIAIILLGMVSLAASSAITTQGRVGVNVESGLGAGLQSVNGLHGVAIGGVGVLSKDELLRQKFILDILQQVNMPLQKQDLLILGDRSDVTNENLYVRPLTQEVVMVLDLIRSQQILGKQNIFTISNEHHMRQMLGLYRLLVTARDFDTFKHLVVYTRQHINTEMFVNALVLALGERNDTKMLVVPALHEILPQLYHHDSVISQVHHLDTGVSSLRPNLVDVVGMGRQNRLLDPRLTEQQSGLWGVLNKSQLWMPWRELHRQLAMRKIVGGNVVQQNENQINTLVINLPGKGLLTEDIGLKAYVNILVDELVVKQDVVRKSTKTQIGMDRDEIDTTSRKRLMSLDGNMRGRRNRVVDNDNGDDDMDMEMNRNIRGRHLDVDVDNVMGSNRLGRVGFGGEDINKRGRMWDSRRLENNMDLDYDRDMYTTDRRTVMHGNMRQGQMIGRQNVKEEQRGINTVSINDARLLFVGRRHKNSNNVVNMGTKHDYVDDIDMISGGRRVDKNDDRTDKDQRQKNMWGNVDTDHYDIRRLNNERLDNSMNRRDTLTQDNDDMTMRQWQGKGVGWGMGHDRDDSLNIVTRGKNGQRQVTHDDLDIKMWNRGYLPTSSIDDERLLQINRRKLNNKINDEHRSSQVGVWNNDYDDDDNRYSSINQRNIVGHSRFDDERNIMGRSRLSSLGINRRDELDEDDMNTNRYLGRDIKTGHRYRRSLDQQVWRNDNINEKGVNGKLLLHTLQQLVARINIERIALGKPQLIDDQLTGIGHIGVLGSGLNQHLAINRNTNLQTINKIVDIIHRIDHVLQQNVHQLWSLTYNDKIEQIGQLLAGQIEEIGLINILGEVLKEDSQLHRGQVANIIDNEVVQTLLANIVKIIDANVQEIFKTREEHISNVRGIIINNVEIDKLQTYLEQTEVDLSNLAQDNIDLSKRGNSKKIVGRVPRLNHKSFHIDIDVTSERHQQVVVRNLLVPKVDGVGNILPLVERRQNAILLDITTVNLKPGHNLIKLKSKDISLTSRDTTPYTKIYERVMRALDGEILLSHEQISGQTDMLPHRLLIPRGRVNGLPMQLVTVITPVQDNVVLGHSVSDLDVSLLDRLPLNYPLHCDITDLDKMLTKTNVMVKDVKIYHDDSIKNMY